MRRAPAILLLTLSLAAGCGESSVKPISTRRTARTASEPVLIGATSRQRFGPMGGGPSAASQQDAPAAGSGGLPPFEYDLPDGWNARAASGMRVVDLQVAGDPSTEAYLTLLGGSGGGLEANIERWQAQMGDEGQPAPVVERGEVPLLGGQAVLVVIDGHYRGMGQADLAEARMVAAILPSSQFTVFAKMVGPRAVVEPEQEAFRAWCASLRLGAELRAEEPPAGPSAGSPSAPSAPAPGERSVAWSLPPGWRELGPRPMRLATLVGPEGVEISISEAGGSPRANANRWLGQVGQEALDAAGFDGLPRLQSGLGEAVLVEGTGPFSGMGAADMAEATLLGVIVPRGASNVFVKAVDRPGAVASIRPALEEIVSSLRPGGR